MDDRLDPFLIRKVLLWASFVAFGTAAVVTSLSEPGWLSGIFCLVPWLLHRGFLPRNMPILGTKQKRNFRPATIILASLACAVHAVALLWAAGLFIMEHFPILDSSFGVFLLFLSLIGFLVVWIYILNWFDSLTQIPYYQALSRAIAAISGPPLVVVLLLLLEYSFTGRLVSEESDIFQFQFFKTPIIAWCVVNLTWSLIPWLYILILHKTYQQALQDHKEIDALEEEVVPAEQMEGLPDWFEPLPSDGNVIGGSQRLK